MIDQLTTTLTELGLTPHRVEAGVVVELPSERRGSFNVLIAPTERALSLRAFIMRNPDREHLAVYGRLLEKNNTAADWRFAIDGFGDVFLTAYVPHTFAAAESLDGLLGGACAAVDEVFEGIVRAGFDIPEGTALKPPTD